jgi:hypothetical protein
MDSLVSRLGSRDGGYRRNLPCPAGEEEGMSRWDLLFWIYLVNAILLISHEIDSAYWQEWDLFRVPGGVSGFLLLHFPLLFAVLYGLVLVYQQTFAGLTLSLLLSLAGLFAFSIHTYFLRRGRDEFKAPISQFILVATLTLSLVQAAVTVYLLLQ